MNDSGKPRVSEPPARRLQQGLLSRLGAFVLIAGAAASFHCPGAPRRVEETGEQAVAVPIPAPLAVPVEPPVVRDERPKTIVMIVIDGARWQEIYGGTDRTLARIHALSPSWILSARELVPALHDLIEKGGAALGAPEHGAEIAASGPAFKSVPGYIEIFSGRPSVDCPNNRCRWSGESNLLDQIAERSERGPADVAVFASWPGMLNAVGTGEAAPQALVSAGRRGGQHLEPLLDDTESARLHDRGARSDGYPGEDDYRPDRHTAELALDHLRRHRPRFLFLSLGDADAFGHANMYRRYLESLRESDKVVGEAARILAEFRAGGWPSTLLVTTDHGRDKRCREHGRKYPESARAWLIASGTGIVDHGYVSAPRARKLADIAPTVRALFGLDADTGATAGTPLTELLSAPVDPRTAVLEP
jgi:hypothetical protein